MHGIQSSHFWNSWEYSDLESRSEYSQEFHKTVRISRGDPSHSKQMCDEYLGTHCFGEACLTDSGKASRGRELPSRLLIARSGYSEYTYEP